MNKSIKIFIKWIAGPLLAIWLFYSLYIQVKIQPDFETELALIQSLPFGVNAGKFWLVIFMVFLNWALEAEKWKLLINTIQPMGFYKALKSVLCGVTLSLHTPNRIGEYAGRVLFVNEGNRLKAVSVSVAGGLAQLIITSLMGCFGLAFLVFSKNEASIQMGVSFFWLKLFLIVCIFITLLLLFFFFRLSLVERLFKKLPYAEKFSRYIEVLGSIDAKILLRLLLLSMCRYVVFILQYIFMLQLMQVEQNYWQSFWLVSVMFLIMAIIPSFAIAELGIRGTIAKTLFAYSNNLVGILTVTFTVWFINLFVPALIGSLLILGIKIKKDK